eukprot:TRINITY_DN10469_c0_g2_i2.p2 TRINITY_DN10469_c0_g2~~TRINITY_DN10469_c0_g2_i2.p2  ORF type:complete len:116 (-),score=9.26 TRINITY_DN10469_c0_g2_i2:325-672(-)
MAEQLRSPKRYLLGASKAVRVMKTWMCTNRALWREGLDVHFPLRKLGGVVPGRTVLHLEVARGAGAQREPAAEVADLSVSRFCDDVAVPGGVREAQQGSSPSRSVNLRIGGGGRG